MWARGALVTLYFVLIFALLWLCLRHFQDALSLQESRISETLMKICSGQAGKNYRKCRMFLTSQKDESVEINSVMPYTSL
uniref:Secreted protein n=1 Tax=Steinernema glaseri TaxID=37863 RepID=A0A1I7ZAB1_9BILA